MMKRKRKAAFTAHVLDKLFPSADNTSSESATIKSSDRKTQKSQDASKLKVYGAHLPPDVAKQLEEENTRRYKTEENNSNDDGTSDSSDSEQVSKKRKRKKKRKHNMPHMTSEGQQGAEIKPEQNQNNFKLLTKNQKRKMRKKRRHKMQQGDNEASEFTFEPEMEEEETNDVQDKEELKREINSDVKEFIQSVWCVYQREGAKSTTSPGLHQAAIDTLFLVIAHFEVEILNSIQHWKRLLILRDAERARKQVKTLKKYLAHEHVLVLNNLTEYWLNDVIKVSSQT